MRLSVCSTVSVLVLSTVIYGCGGSKGARDASTDTPADTSGGGDIRVDMSTSDATDVSTADAMDASTADAMDASTADAMDASTTDAMDASTTDVMDASVSDASDASATDASASDVSDASVDVVRPCLDAGAVDGGGCFGTL